MGMIKNSFQWEIKRVKNLYPDFGLAILINKGCLGTTYGKEGRHMFYDIILTLLWWTWAFRSHWYKL